MGPRAVIVLDSNIFVSALGWRGAPHEFELGGYEGIRIGSARDLLKWLDADVG